MQEKNKLIIVLILLLLLIIFCVLQRADHRIDEIDQQMPHMGTGSTQSRINTQID